MLLAPLADYTGPAGNSDAGVKSTPAWAGLGLGWMQYSRTYVAY